MSNVMSRRATSLPEMGALLGRLFRPEETAASIASYHAQPGDVIIAPFAKCGTTWLQQIFHCLRTRGDMDFDDISRVVPWIERAVVSGVALDTPQRAAPRGFKSHLSYDQMPRGGRYIVSLRDPKDALVSMYRFIEGWLMEPGAISLDAFSASWTSSREDSGYWSHLVGWWGQRDNPDVLLLSYEGMNRDPTATIQRVAEFCGLPLDDELLAMTLERSSLAYMLQHKDRFDDFLMRSAAIQRCNLPADGDASKVRKGGAGGHRQEMSPELNSAMDAIWAERVTRKLGFADYAALEAALVK